MLLLAGDLFPEFELSPPGGQIYPATRMGAIAHLRQTFLDVRHDAQQCGFCTPGFVVACKAFLDKQPHPTIEQLKTVLAGNLCRCGTYMGVRAAVMQVAKGGQSNG